MNFKTQVLYISYDGMTDPLGQSQVLSYLRILSQYEFSFHILSYEKKERYDQYRVIVEDFIRGYDINWTALEYSNKFPIFSTIGNIRAGKRKIRELNKVYSFKIVHCRGYIASVMGEWLKKRTGARFIFDMRGWWPDEKKEAGDWASALYQPVYNYFKKRERNFFRNSDISISLTQAGKEYIVSNKLKEQSNVDVIPTCVNFDIFPAFNNVTRTKVRQTLNLPESAMVMIYSGSLGGNYRADVMMRFFKHLLELQPDSFFLFITHTSSDLVDKAIAESEIAFDRFRKVKASYKEVNEYLMAGDIGIIVYSNGFSTIGRSPTKLGEYWACGLKALSIKGIGDLEYLIKKYEGSGVIAESIGNNNAFKDAIETVLQITITKDKLRSFAEDYFDLNKGCNRYLENYRKLIKEPIA